MFSRIPQKFSSFLGDEAKLAFPTQPGGISKLATVRVRDPFNGPDGRAHVEYFRYRQLLGAGTNCLAR